MYIGSWQEYKLARLIADQNKQQRRSEQNDIKPVIIDAARPITRNGRVMLPSLPPRSANGTPLPYGSTALNDSTSSVPSTASSIRSDPGPVGAILHRPRGWAGGATTGGIPVTDPLRRPSSRASSGAAANRAVRRNGSSGARSNNTKKKNTNNEQSHKQRINKMRQLYGLDKSSTSSSDNEAMASLNTTPPRPTTGRFDTTHTPPAPATVAFIPSSSSSSSSIYTTSSGYFAAPTTFESSSSSTTTVRHRPSTAEVAAALATLAAANAKQNGINDQSSTMLQSGNVIASHYRVPSTSSISHLISSSTPSSSSSAFIPTTSLAHLPSSGTSSSLFTLTPTATAYMGAPPSFQPLVMNGPSPTPTTTTQHTTIRPVSSSSYPSINVTIPPPVDVRTPTTQPSSRSSWSTTTSSMMNHQRYGSMSSPTAATSITRLPSLDEHRPITPLIHSNSSHHMTLPSSHSMTSVPATPTLPPLSARSRLSTPGSLSSSMEREADELIGWATQLQSVDDAIIV